MAIKDDKLRDAGLLVLRIGLGLVMLYYGLQMSFGAFQGHSFQAEILILQTKYGVPRWLAIMGILGIFGGSIGSFLGLFTRVAAFGMACAMAVVTFTAAAGLGVMRGVWTGDPVSPPVVFYPFAIFIMALTLLLTGPGAMSLDRKIFKGGKKSAR